MKIGEVYGQKPPTYFLLKSGVSKHEIKVKVLIEREIDPETGYFIKEEQKELPL